VDLFTVFHLGLTPQALCCRLLRRLKAKVLKRKTPHNLVYGAMNGADFCEKLQ
jgi:hypothetical protein